VVLRLIGQIFTWLLTWLYYVLIICIVGAMLGVVTHILFGWIFVGSPDYRYLASFGFSNGIRYGAVWAGGLAIVLCVMRARKAYLLKKTASEEAAK
jgi:hypothetical protein